MKNLYSEFRNNRLPDEIVDQMERYPEDIEVFTLQEEEEKTGVETVWPKAVINR